MEHESESNLLGLIWSCGFNENETCDIVYDYTLKLSEQLFWKKVKTDYSLVTF